SAARCTRSRRSPSVEGARGGVTSTRVRRPEGWTCDGGRRHQGRLPPEGELSGSLGDRVVQRDRVPAVLHVRDLIGEAAHGVLVPQREGRQVLHEDRLGRVELLVRGVDVRRGEALLEELVELGVLVVAVVAALAVRRGGGVQRAEEVVDGGVVRLPAGAEGTFHGAGRDLLAEL